VWRRICHRLLLLFTSNKQVPPLLLGNSRGHLPLGMAGTGPVMGPPALNSVPESGGGAGCGGGVGLGAGAGLGLGETGYFGIERPGSL
jgi:hypothetical protein